MNQFCFTARRALCEMARDYDKIYSDTRENISPMLLGMLDEGKRVSLCPYLDAKNLLTEISGVVDTSLKDFDADITLAKPAEAIEGLASISLPLLTGASGIPLGLQLVGSRGSDSRLLQGAHWLEEIHLSEIDE